MGNNSKLLSILSLLIVILGVGFLFLGTADSGKISESPLPSIKNESSPIATTSATLGIEGERALVTKVIDGDTIEIENGATIRLIGIDTPETKDPRRPVGCFGKEASSETKKLLDGKQIILQKDISETDKYKRLLRYIYLPLGNDQVLFVNDYLVREGFAKVLTYPPDVKYNEQFREAEKQAREGKKGLWGRC